MIEEVADQYKKIMDAAPPVVKPKAAKEPASGSDSFGKELVRTPEEIERDESIEERTREIFEKRRAADPESTKEETEPNNDDYTKATYEIMSRKGVKGSGVGADQPLVPPAGEPLPIAPVPDAAPVAPEPAPVLSAEEIAKKDAEEKAEKRLAELKEKMDDFSELYAKYSGEAYASQGFISRLVGKHKENDPMIAEYRSRWIEAKDFYEKALNGNLRNKFERGKITEKEYRAQTVNLKLESLMRKLFMDERKMYFQNKKGEDRGWLSEKVEKGTENFIKVWKKIPFFAKMAAGFGLSIIGGPASVIGLGVLRVAGAVVGGKAAQEKLQAKAINKRKKDIEKEMRRFEMEANLADMDKLYNLANGSLDRSNKKLSDKIISEANWDAGRKIAGIATGIVIEELGRLGAGKWLLNKGLNYFGFGSIGAEAIGGKKGGTVPEKIGGKGPVTTPEGAGKGAIVPEKVEKQFLGNSHKIKSGENVWKVTRDMYIEHAKEYELKPDDPKIKNLFQSLKKQGFLHRMGINASNFNDLSDADKIKILAENKTANAMEWYKSHHGGKLPSVVKEGYMVTLDDKGKLFVGDTSHIRAGAVHHEPTHGAGRAVAEHHMKGKGAFEPSGKKPAWLEVMNEKQKILQEEFAKKAKISAETHDALVQSRENLAAASAAEAAKMDSTQTHKWMDFIQERIYGKGTTVDWQQSAREFRQKFLGSFISSDQPMPPANVGEQSDFWRAAQELNKKLGPTVGNESVEQWLTRGLEQGQVSSEDVLRLLNRVVNQ